MRKLGQEITTSSPVQGPATDTQSKRPAWIGGSTSQSAIQETEEKSEYKEKHKAPPLAEQKSPDPESLPQILVLNAHGGMSDKTINLTGTDLTVLSARPLTKAYTMPSVDLEPALKKDRLLPAVKDSAWCGHKDICPDVILAPLDNIDTLKSKQKEFSKNILDKVDWWSHIDSEKGCYFDRDKNACLVLRKSDGSYVYKRNEDIKTFFQKIRDDKAAWDAEGTPVFLYAPQVLKVKILGKTTLSEITTQLNAISGKSHLIVLNCCNATKYEDPLVQFHSDYQVNVDQVPTDTSPNKTELQREKEAIQKSKFDNPKKQMLLLVKVEIKILKAEIKNKKKPFSLSTLFSLDADLKKQISKLQKNIDTLEKLQRNLESTSTIAELNKTLDSEQSLALLGILPQITPPDTESTKTRIEKLLKNSGLQSTSSETSTEETAAPRI